MRDESIKAIFQASGIGLEDQGGGRMDLAPNLYAAARALLKAAEGPALVAEVPNEELAGAVDNATKRVSAMVERILRSGAVSGTPILKDPAEAAALIISDIRAKAAGAAPGDLHVGAKALEEILQQHLRGLLSSTGPRANWLPMVTAPKDRDILLKRPGRGVGIGRWEPQLHHKIPRPYWADDRAYFSVTDNRNTEPTGWMEIPHE